MSITAILNGFRRPQHIQMQINHILNQTVKPEEIWLWRNYHEDWNIELPTLQGVDKYCESNYNWKYFGRFSLAMMARTEFVAFFDDDTIPGNMWFENCVNTHSQVNGILGGVGLVHHNDNQYGYHTRFGWPSYNEQVVKVDLVGHAWFVKKDYLRYVWFEEPVTYETGEDMHLSYICQKYGNIETFVPPHPKSNLEMSSSLYGYELGTDDKTDSVVNHAAFVPLRNNCFRGYVKRGWKLLYNVGD